MLWLLSQQINLECEEEYDPKEMLTCLHIHIATGPLRTHRKNCMGIDMQKHVFPGGLQCYSMLQYKEMLNSPAAHWGWPLPMVWV